MACWQNKFCTLIWHTICKSLMKIQYFGHEHSSIMYKIPKKRIKIKGPSITCSYIWHVNISKYVNWLDTHSVNVWWRYVPPNKCKCRLFLWCIFQTLGSVANLSEERPRHWAVLPTCQKNGLENQKSSSVRTN